MTKTNKKKLTAKEFDAKAENAKQEDLNELAEYFDPDSGTKRFNIDMPIWALRKLDQEATRRGVSRQALVKGWLIDRLDQLEKEQKDRRAVPA